MSLAREPEGPRCIAREISSAAANSSRNQGSFRIPHPCNNCRHYIEIIGFEPSVRRVIKVPKRCVLGRRAKAHRHALYAALSRRMWAAMAAAEALRSSAGARQDSSRLSLAMRHALPTIVA
jgi:hypothetical protein